MSKLKFYEFLGNFIPYFKKVFMSSIYKILKNSIDNRFNEYDKYFEMSLIINSDKPFSVKYLSTYQGVEFSIEIEYIDNQIQFSSFVNVAYSSSTVFEISSFLQFVESMQLEDLHRKLDFYLKK